MKRQTARTARARGDGAEKSSARVSPPHPRAKSPGTPTKTTHPLRLFAGSANLPLAHAVAKALGTKLGGCTTTHLPDTEVHVLLDDPVRDDDIFFIQPCPPPVNDNLLELLLYLDAFRRASAHSITAVVP
ncbi:MAG: ribose-phosphate pyrophosphokinase-like domain-containing protein, partial [Candidatus Eisenbacteria bacterium]|nr:ribose-phosphate pyrophosphokinase-like domain-containing protein [Candidatus Eisenbacteria bacterium]